jgi:hypothetical protein
MFSLYGQFYKQTDGMAVVSAFFHDSGFYMENCVKMPLEQVTHKPVCWFCYIVDNFLILPHRADELESFLDHLTGVHQPIPFTMETLIPVYAGAWKAHRATKFTESLLTLIAT